jgi:hypothetical protein
MIYATKNCDLCNGIISSDTYTIDTICKQKLLSCYDKASVDSTHDCHMDRIFKPSSWTVWDVYHRRGISFRKRGNRIAPPIPSEFWVLIKQPRISILETRRWKYFGFKILADWRTENMKVLYNFSFQVVHEKSKNILPIQFD